jgi:hypothetical protein
VIAQSSCIGGSLLVTDLAIIYRCCTAIALKLGGRKGSRSTRQYAIEEGSEDRQQAGEEVALWGFDEVTPNESARDWRGVVSDFFNKTTWANSSKQPYLGGPPIRGCHTRVSGVQSSGANIITRCARTKSHTYDES